MRRGSDDCFSSTLTPLNVHPVFSTVILVTRKDILAFTMKADKALEGASDPKRMSEKAQVVGLMVGLVVAATGHRESLLV